MIEGGRRAAAAMDSGRRVAGLATMDGGRLSAAGGGGDGRWAAGGGSGAGEPDAHALRRPGNEGPRGMSITRFLSVDCVICRWDY